MGTRKFAPNMPRPKMNSTALLTAKLKFSNSLILMSGCWTLNSAMRNRPRPSTARAKHARMKLEVQPPVFHAELPLDSANSSAVRPTVSDRNPTMSKPPSGAGLCSRNTMKLTRSPAMPTGTFTSKMVFHANRSMR
ncbi:MAG: hypothetical protein P8099_05285 [Gemmatimonadota bacterium]